MPKPSAVRNITTIEEALSALGVTDETLTPKEKKALDEQGYFILSDAIEPKVIKQLREVFEQLCEQERVAAGHQTPQTSGTRHLADLISKSPLFQHLYTHPKLLAAVYYVLKREFHLTRVSGRDPLPGYGAQGLHADWVTAVAEFQVVNSLWLLDSFTAESGPTRLVPGSHLLKHMPDKKLLAPTRPYSGEVFALAPAGSAIIFNAHIWHSGTHNQKQAHRRVIDCLFNSRDASFFNSTETQEMVEQLSPAAPPAFLEQVSPAVRYLLGR